MALIAIESGNAGRPHDEIDNQNQARCWSFHLHHHKRVDKLGVLFANCDRLGEVCHRCHKHPEATNEEALNRLEGLRNVQLEKYEAAKAKRAEKKGKKAEEQKCAPWKADGKAGQNTRQTQPTWTKGQSNAAGQAGSGRAWCSLCENNLHTNRNCPNGGEKVPRTQRGRVQEADVNEEWLNRKVAAHTVAALEKMFAAPPIHTSGHTITHTCTTSRGWQ